MTKERDPFTIARPFQTTPRLTILGIFLILVAGFAATMTIPRQEDPLPRERYGRVTTFFPGASAERIETLITEKVEDEVSEIEEVKEINSTSRTGVSQVIIELNDDVFKTDEVWSRIREKMDNAATLFPADAQVPELTIQKLPAVTILVALTAPDERTLSTDENAGDARPLAEPTIPLAILHRLGKDLETRLRNIGGTEETELYGEPEEEYLITVDPAALAGAGLTVSDLSRALAAADSKSPAGQVRSDRNAVILEVTGELSSAERIREIPVANSTDGRLLRLGDLADVQRAARLPAPTVAYFNGERGVAVSVIMQQNQRIDKWAARARAAIAEFAVDLPSEIKLQTVLDQSVYTQDRLVELAVNFLMGIVLVVAILFVVLGPRSAILVGLALPMSVAVVLTAFKVLGVPLHQMSVTGLVIALGLLIDNAIVVVDEYNLNRSRGLSYREAGAVAVKHLQIPLLASTVTTALTFAPIMLMPGGAGDFVGTMALAVILSIFASLALSLTLLPAVAGFLDRRVPKKGAQAVGQSGFRNPALTKAYLKSLGMALRRPRITIALSLVVPILGFVLASTLASQFFPPVDRDQFQIQLTLPDSAPIAETAATIERVREILYDFDEIEEDHWYLGEGAPKAFYNTNAIRDGVPSFAGATVMTTSAKATRAVLPALQARFLAEVPEAEVLALPFEQGPPIDAPVELRIVGPDIDTLRALGEDVRQRLAASESVTYTRADISGGRPKLAVRAREDEARIAGFSLTDISAQLSADLEGSLGGSVLEGTEELPVRVRFDGKDRSALDRLRSQELSSPGVNGSQGGAIRNIPLSAIAKTELVPEGSVISRRNRERVNTVQAFLVPFTLPSATIADFQNRLVSDPVALPRGYRLEFGGESETQAQAMSNLFSSVGVLLVIMVGTIILSFNSFRFALVIFSVAFLSVGLAFFSLWLFNQTRGFMAIVGAMGLIGLAINGAIVVLSGLRADAAASAGDEKSITSIVMDCTRHIVGTTLTTIGGFLPLIIWGANFWKPLSLAIAGGVIGSAVLALYFTPSAFLLIARQKERARLRRTREVLETETRSSRGEGGSPSPIEDPKGYGGPVPAAAE